MTQSSKSFAVLKSLPAPRPHWVGDAFYVFPVFNRLAFTEAVSPWLMFDYAAPKYFPVNDPISKYNPPLGVGKHPHRGFETVTIAFQGEVEHKDSQGGGGVIGPGDVQWMTAGRGIIHEEYHSAEFSKRGGTFEMCQLWLNLPAKHKMIPPRYQPILSKEIPSVPLYDAQHKDTIAAHARIIAGTLNGTTGPAKTMTPVELWDVNFTSDQQQQLPTSVDIPVPSGHTLIVFVRRGGITLNTTGGSDGKTKTTKLGPQAVALLGDGVESDDAKDETSVFSVTPTKKDTSIMILAGEPIKEPIANMGPFVMNTYEELRQASNDYHSGRMGR